jgi:cytochrome c biogenesis protein CcdA
MSNQEKFAPYAAITIGSVGLIASTIALTMYHSSLSSLIVGGMIGSVLPLFAYAVLGIVSFNKDFCRKNVKEKEHIELIDNSSKPAGPAIAGAVVPFGGISCSWCHITYNYKFCNSNSK